MKFDNQKLIHKTDKQFCQKDVCYIYTFLNFKCKHVITKVMKLNGSVSELENSTVDVLVTITPKCDARPCLACDAASVAS